MGMNANGEIVTDQIVKAKSIGTYPSVLFLGDGGVSEEVRVKMPADRLVRYGWEATAQRGAKMNVHDITQDILVLSRVVYPPAIEILHQKGKKVIFDIDDNFFAIPPKHPGYKYVGKGNPDYISQLETCLRTCDIITTTTPELKTLFLQYNPKVVVIPNGWDKFNKLWRVKYAHDTINIGWAGTITHRTDILQVKDTLIKLVKGNPKIVLYIGGDPEIYLLFHSLPEKQKCFIPMLPYEYYPHLFSYLDIWLAPLADDEFNQGKSDIKLVEAGTSGTCWVASDTPSYARWAAGGLLVSGNNSWYSQLCILINDRNLRKNLAMEGRQAANWREMGMLLSQWEEVFVQVMK